MLYNLGQLAKLAAAAIASNLPGRENISASRRSIRRFVITEKAPTRHNAKRALTPPSLNVKLGPRHNYHKGRAAIRHYANQTARPL